MKLAIPPELETLIQQVIERGQYDDPLEAIAAGLASWHNDHARLSEWWDGLGPSGQREFAESIDDAASGSFVDLEPGYFDSLRARARAKAMGRETA